MSVYEEVQKQLATDQYEEMEWKSFELEWIDRFQRDHPPSYGREMKKAFFPLLQDNFLAHGSYGAASSVAISAMIGWQCILEVNPADFYHNQLFDCIVRSSRHLANYLETNPLNVVLVKNVEVGIQSVLKSFTREGPYLCFDITYGAVKTCLESFATERSSNLLQIKLSFPISKSSILQDTSLFLKEYYALNNPPISLCLLEHISSPTAILFPVKELAHLLHEYKIAVCVDGAHAIGSLDPLKVDDLGVDFYTSNLHKWLCSPRGCAFLYIHPRYHSVIRPLLISWGWNYPMQSKFIWQGTDDHSAHLSIPIMIKFFRWLPSPTLRNHELAIWTGNTLSRIWGTKQLVDDGDMIASMVCVQLPEPFKLETEEENLQNLAYQVKAKYKIEAPTFSFMEKRWIRVSLHIYNSKEEVFTLAKRMLEVLHYPTEHASFLMLQKASSVSALSTARL